jgi:hypothetical protein
MQLPEPVRKASAAIGHARNFHWLFTIGSGALTVAGIGYSRFLAPLPPGQRLLIIGGAVLIVMGVILGLLQHFFPGPQIPVADPHPVASALPPLPLEQTTAEKSLVQDYRTMWNRYGLGAVQALYDLLRDVTWELKQKHYWAPLLNDQFERLDRAQKAMSNVVAFENKPRIAETSEAFNEVYTKYTDACVWIAKIQKHEDVLEREPYNHQLVRWKRLQRTLSDRLRDMDQIPEHHQTMKIYLKPAADGSLRQLMQDAEGE